MDTYTHPQVSKPHKADRYQQHATYVPAYRGPWFGGKQQTPPLMHNTRLGSRFLTVCCIENWPWPLPCLLLPTCWAARVTGEAKVLPKEPSYQKHFLSETGLPKLKTLNVLQFYRISGGGESHLDFCERGGRGRSNSEASLNRLPRVF